MRQPAEGDRAPGPLLLVGLGPVAGCADDFDQLALELLEPAPLFIALLAEEQVAAVGALLGRAGAAAETERAVLDRNRDAFPPAAAGQVPLPLIGGQAVAMGIADVIEDHRLVACPGAGRRARPTICR